MPLHYFEAREKAVVWAISLAIGLGLMAYPVVTGLYVPRPPVIEPPMDIKAANFILAGILVCVVGPGMVEYMNYRWVREAERGLAAMFSGLASTVRSGLILGRGMEVVRDMVTAPLAREIDRCMARVRMGMDFEEAVTKLGERLKSPRIAMANMILVEASKSGGTVAEVLDHAKRFYESYNEYEDEKATSLKPYGMVLYAGALIFIAISYMLIHQFLLPLLEVAREASAPFLAAIGDIDYYKMILYYSSFIENMFSGLIIGKLTGGSVKCGVKHILILCLITMLAFNLVI